ncbi:hypothetical protein Tco_1395513 [Tanacetum coccineum]
MAPKRATATTTPMIDSQLKALIAQGVANALAERDADRSRNGDDNYDSGTGGRRQAPPTLIRKDGICFPYQQLHSRMSNQVCNLH